MDTWGVTFKASGVSLTTGFYLICESPPTLPAETSTDHSSSDNKWPSHQDNGENRAHVEQSSSCEDTILLTAQKQNRSDHHFESDSDLINIYILLNLVNIIHK